MHAMLDGWMDDQILLNARAHHSAALKTVVKMAVKTAVNKKAASTTSSKYSETPLRP